MSNNKFRRAMTIAALAAGAALVLPAAASADPIFGTSTGSGLIDDPVGTAQAGSSSIAADPVDALRVGLGIADEVFDGLGFGSSDLGLPQLGVRTQNCNASTQAGGPGVTETYHVLRPGPTSFLLEWETLDVPDEIVVFYQGAPIFNTGYVGDNANEGTGSAFVNVPPGGDNRVMVRVTGPGGTEWSYRVNC